MNFPQHNIIPDNELVRDLWDEHLRACSQKRIGFQPFAICDFFTDMQVLQVYSERRKEAVYGIYLNRKNCGMIYTGEKYSEADLQQIKADFIPEFWDDIDLYIREKSGIWYQRFPLSHFAWIYDRILTKV